MKKEKGIQINFFLFPFSLKSIPCPCVASFWAKKKKPVKAQISDFFYASKDNLQIHKKSRRSKSVPSLINCPCVARFWAGNAMFSIDLDLHDDTEME
jgi:hypothetical protein